MAKARTSCIHAETLAQLGGRGGIRDHLVDRAARVQQARLAERHMGEVAAGHGEQQHAAADPPSRG